MSALERALRELESATAIAIAPAQDLGAAREAIYRRQQAIADLCRLTDALHSLPQAESEEALLRLRAVSEAAAAVETRLLTVKSDAMAEWNQWSQIYRALGAAGATKSAVVDYSG